MVINEILRGFMDRAAFACTWSDLDGRIVFANKALCNLLGVTCDEIVGSDFKQYYSSLSQETLDSTIFPEVLEKGEWVGELELLSDNGNASSYTHNLFVIMEGNEAQYVAAAIMDIAERKKYEELLHTDKLTSLGTLVAGVAHEINNANTFIKLGGPGIGKVWESIYPLVKEHCDENGIEKVGNLSTSNMGNYVGKLIEGIDQGSDRIQSLVTELKNFARGEKPDFGKVVEVNDIVMAAELLVGSKIKRATYNFSADYGQNIPHILGSRQQIEQVVVNLLVNSCEALDDPKKKISISTGFNEKDRTVFITVEDEGGGIPDEILEHITDSFFTTKLETGGTGLGLAISSRIVSDHGGDLSFDSRVGEGTSATITLPLPPLKETVS